jgi:hypothetical protein
MATVDGLPTMNRKKKFTTLLLAALLFVVLASACNKQTRRQVVQRDLPPVILWAWERPEDLQFLDAKRFGVAFLAQTLVLKGNKVDLNPRHQPLKVSPTTKLIAVTRVESKKSTGEKAGLTSSQRQQLVTLIARTAQLENVSAVQVDFDAGVSERQFYRELLEELRQKLPERVGLSITALASFCVGDRWLDDLPVDEAVPMIFRMGADDKNIKNFLAAGQDFREPLCQASYGIALDEPLQLKFAAARRVYAFADRAWTEKDVALLEERLGK